MEIGKRGDDLRTSFKFTKMSTASPSLPGSVFQSMLEEMAAKKFDVIRFPAYRAACKLRFIQKKTNIQHVDIWNAIEAIRENGLHAFQDENGSKEGFFPVSRLQTMITSIFYQLSKRLPPSQRINFEQSVSLFYSFLLSLFDPESRGFVNVFSVKLTLVMMSQGKIEDKLTYIFSLVSDPSNGTLIPDKFKWFIRDLFSLARGVNECPDHYFNFDESFPSRLLSFDHSIRLKEFIELITSPKAAPVCFSFFMAFCRMPDVEQVIHPVSCEGCHRSNFTGYRYKCQKCFNFHLCQDCFWRGRSSGSHDPDSHLCREFSYWQSTSASIRRSFRCLPSHKPVRLQVREEILDKKIDLKHIVPPSPVFGRHHLPHHAFNQMGSNKVAPSSPFTRGSLAYGSMPNMHPSNAFFPPSPRIAHQRQVPSNPLINNGNQTLILQSDENDEQQRLAHEYVRRMSGSKGTTPVLSRKGSFSNHSNDVLEISEKQRIIAKLEQQNRQMMMEIERLRRGDVTIQDLNRGGIISSPSASNTTSQGMMEPLYATELSALRMRKDELEKHLSTLHDSRKELLLQLESLMTLLKSQGSLLTSTPSSATSTMTRSGQQQKQQGIQSSNSFRVRSTPASESVKKAVTSLAKELNAEDEETINELGLNLSKKLTHLSGQPSATSPSNRSNGLSPKLVAKGSFKSRSKDDFDEEELALNKLRDQMIAMRKSSLNQGKEMDADVMTSSLISRTSILSNDDDTDIYPDSDDDEFYTKSWNQKKEKVQLKGH